MWYRRRVTTPSPTLPSATTPPTEPEITTPVDLCLPNGKLNRQAVGWSRHPLQRCNLSAGWPFRKRWDFWGVQTDTHLLRMTHGCTDYLGLLAIDFLDYSVGKAVQATRNPPFAHGMGFPPTVGGGRMAYVADGFGLEISEEDGGTRLRGHFHKPEHRLDADVFIARPPGHETLNVVIPWSNDRFQFTSKQNTRPATGYVDLNGKRFSFGPDNHAYGILDYGRGVWPYNTTWNWASASGIENGRVIGLNLGGKWTDRTGCTENGLCVDGRLHKLSEDLLWEYDVHDFSKPWRIRAPQSGRVDLVFTPRIEEQQKIEAFIVRSELHWALGTFAGKIVTDQGETLTLTNLLGWAEEHRARW